MKKRKSGPTITRAPRDRENPYSQVRRATVEDRNLSWEARGVLAYLLVKKDDWILQVNDLIASSPGGRDKVYRILAELEKHGYLERHNEKTDDGKFGGVSYHLYELPLPGNPYAGSPLPEKPYPGKPLPEKPYPGKPLPEKPEHSNKEELPSTKKAPSTEEKECASADADAPPTPNAQGDYESIFGKGTTSFDPPAQATPKQSIAEEWNKPLFEMEPHRAMFAAVLDAVGWDRATLTERDRVQVAQVCRILRDAGYEYHDIGDFMQEIWFQDWRWEKNRSRPTLNQIRQEIGKLRVEDPVANHRFMPSETDLHIDSVVARMKAQGIQYGQH